VSWWIIDYRRTTLSMAWNKKGAAIRPRPNSLTL
jgi:hypothetical protein